MNFKNYILFINLFFLAGCIDHDLNNNVKKVVIEKKYSNKGFTLIYNDSLKDQKKISKKIDDRSLLIFHDQLKKNSIVKIKNLLNNKVVIAKVKSNKVIYSNFFNSVITARIAEELELDIEKPYVEITLISNNSTFIAKKAKTFDQEKNVAQKAPVDSIQINDLNNKILEKKKLTSNIFSFTIKIADFYYLSSAKSMIKKLDSDSRLNNLRIKELSKTKFRVLLGPFSDINELEVSFNKIKSFGFENIEILNNV